MSSSNDELRKAGLKATLPRIKIYQLLEDSTENDHWSAEEIYKHLMLQGEEIGLATIYRVLTQFEAAGLAMRHRFENGHSVFELASDDNHDHIVCVKTGEVKEFNDPILNARIEEIALEHGFEMTGRTLHIYGLKKADS